MSLFSIENQVIVVTGAAGVLAGSTARYLQEQGAFVVYLDLHQAQIDNVLTETRQISDKCSGYACDVVNEEAVDAVLEKIVAEVGVIDCLMNGAGGNLPGAVCQPSQDVFDVSMDDYSKVVDLNLKGTVIPTLAFSKIFSKQKHGCIINFSSMASNQALTRVMGYSQAKAAVDNFTKWMATEMALKYGDKIRVCAVAPGFFVSNQNRKLLLNEDGSVTERGQQILNKTPFKRFGEPSEVFGVVHFLISDAARFVTGIVLPVDGGFSAFSGV